MDERSMTDSPDRQPAGRRFVWVWVLVLLAALFAAPRVVSYVMIQRTEQRINDVVASLPFEIVPPEDLPATWGPPPEPQDNAAPLLDEACEMFDALLAAPTSDDASATDEPLSNEFERLQVIWVTLDPDDYPQDRDALSPEEARAEAIVDAYMKEVIEKGTAELTPEVWKAIEARSKRPPPTIPPRDVERVRRFLSRCDGVLRLLDEASRRPAYRRRRSEPLTEWGGDVHGDDLRLVMSLLQLRIVVETHEEHWDQAYETVLCGARVVQLAQLEPTYSGFVKANLAYRPLIHEQTVQDLLWRHGPSQTVADQFSATSQLDARWQVRHLVPAVAATPCQSISAARLEAERPWRGSAATGFVLLYAMADVAALLEDAGRIVRAIDEPRQESLRAIQAIEDDVSGDYRTLAGVPLLLRREISRTMTWLAKETYRVDADERLTAVAFHLAAYRQAHGAYPATLAALPHADRLPRDPYTMAQANPEGNSFGYRTTDDGGAVLWSVGPDGADDGGKTAEDLGVDPDAGGDLVLTLPGPGGPKPEAAEE